jgi:hypothetical protein
MGIVDLLELTRNRSQELMQLMYRTRCSAQKERFFCKSRFGFLGFGFFGLGFFVKQMERIVRMAVRPLFSLHFYNKFSVPLYLSVGSRYMLEGQKLKLNVESLSRFRLNPKNPYVEVDSSDSNLI